VTEISWIRQIILSPSV